MREILQFRYVVVVVAASTITLVLLSFEHWDRERFLGFIGVLHVALAVLLSLRQPRESPVHWLALAMALLGTRFASILLTPGWDSLGTGRFSIAGALSPMAAGALLAFARSYGAHGLPKIPRPAFLRYIDRWSFPIGVGISLFFLWDPPHLDKEIFHAPWALFATIRTLQYVAGNFRVADPEERLRLKWLLFASIFWLSAPMVLFLQAFGLGGRAALGIAGVIVLTGSSVLVFGILARGTLDPQLAMERTALIAVLATVLAFTFGVAEAAASDVLLNSLGLPSGSGLWLAAGLVAVLIRPLERVLSPRVNSWMARWKIGIEGRH